MIFISITLVNAAWGDQIFDTKPIKTPPSAAPAIKAPQPGKINLDQDKKPSANMDVNS